MKKIAIILERADIALGGAERSVFELATALSALGFEIDILAAKGQIDAKNVHILCQGAFGKRVAYFAFEKALKRYLQDYYYDIVHSVLPFDFADIYQPRGGTYAESIVRNAESYQNKIFGYYKRATAFANIRRTILLQAERKLCHNPKGPLIVAISQYVAKQFNRHYDLDEKRLAIIPNGIIIKKQINQNQADGFRTRILTELGLKEADNPILFLFVANNFRLKGLTEAIKALSRAGSLAVLPQRRSRKELKLSAKQHSSGRRRPPQSEGYLIVAGNDKMFRYKRLAKKLGVLNKVVFLGPVSYIQELLSIIDVAIMPTFYDPCSRFILEALAAGKPVITTKFNGAIDLFENNRHGIVIDDPKDTAALAKAISYFTDPTNIKKASQAIEADNLKEKISINRVAKQLVSVYEGILQSRNQK